jgi:ankyrin repeat protein
MIQDERDLYEAVEQNDFDEVKRLLDLGASPNTDDDGWTVLMLACAEGYKEIAELLIDRGAEVNAKDEDGNTALYFATLEEHEDIIELLKENGAVE